jgi:hypothetical protein
MNKNLHGGRRASRRSASRRASKRASRRAKRASRRSKRASRRNTRRQSGGAADYPGSLSALLPTDLRGPADVAYTFNSFAQLPAFVGKYGGVGGGKRTRKQRGGAEGFGYTPGPTNVPNYMILSPQDEPKAFLNPQWYTENEVVPSFQGPTNAFAQQSYNNQFNYAQRAGSRKGRKAQKASRKSRKARKARKTNRKH